MAINNDMSTVGQYKLLTDIREIEYRQLKSVQRIERVIIGFCAALMTLICLLVLLWIYSGMY